MYRPLGPHNDPTSDATNVAPASLSALNEKYHSNSHSKWFMKTKTARSFDMTKVKLFFERTLGSRRSLLLIKLFRFVTEERKTGKIEMLSWSSDALRP